MLIEFLDARHRNEMEAEEVQSGYLVMDRCIYEDYYIFAKNAKAMGDLIRAYH